MAAITTTYVLPSLAEAIQRVQADYQLYAPNATWTFVMTSQISGTLRALQTVINDTVDVNTRIYAMWDNQNGDGLDLRWLSQQSGVADVSPPVMFTAAGGRDMLTDWTAKIFDLLANYITSWSNSVQLAQANQTFSSPATGMTFQQLSKRICGFGKTFFFTALVVRRDPVTTTVLTPSNFRSLRGDVSIPAPAPAPASDAVMARIAAALEAIVMSRIDVTLNHGGQVYSATTQVGP